MKIGLMDIDGHNYPNLALMKISAYHKALGDDVEWADALFGEYDKVYKSKVFTFTDDDYTPFNCEVIKGGTGYDYTISLPNEIDLMQPDYSIYSHLVDNRTAYGFLTRGCPNKCNFCIVHKKEGDIRPYMDIDEIAINGRTNVYLMDNNILASDYGLGQIEKIIDRGYRVDFNQGLDARLITDDIAKILAQVRHINYIRIACDSYAQVPYLIRAQEMLERYGYKKDIFVYFLIRDWEDVNKRLDALRKYKWFKPHGQPYRNFNDKHQVIPQWQKDMAHWMNKHNVFFSCEFKDFEPRKGFKCKKYYE